MPPKQTHRMCVITRKKLPISQLFRIVRTPDSRIALEQDAHLEGRGMYVTKDPYIISQLFSPKKHGMWTHALKCHIPQETKQQIQDKIHKITVNREHSK